MGIGRTVHRWQFALCLVLLALGAGIAMAKRPTAGASFDLPQEVARQVMPPVAYRLAGIDRVRVRRDIRYGPASSPQALMDIYLPPKVARRPLPAVLLIHGSTDIRLRPKDWGFFQSWARLIAASGLAAFTFTQDLPARGPQLPAAAQSVSAALSFVKSHGREMGIDPSRLCLAVFSAGGPLVSPYLTGADPSIRCISAYYPLLDLEQGRSFVRYESADSLSRFSPVLQLARPGPRVPLLIARGGRDELPGIRPGIDSFMRAALDLNWPVTLFNHPQGPHGFDNQVRDRRTREIIRATLAFFAEHLEAGRPRKIQPSFASKER